MSTLQQNTEHSEAVCLGKLVVPPPVYQGCASGVPAVYRRRTELPGLPARLGFAKPMGFNWVYQLEFEPLPAQPAWENSACPRQTLYETVKLIVTADCMVTGPSLPNRRVMWAYSPSGQSAPPKWGGLHFGYRVGSFRQVGSPPWIASAMP